MSDFHEPEEPELEEIEKILLRKKLDNVLKQLKKGCKIAYRYDGNFTFAVVKSGNDLFLGASKRNTGGIKRKKIDGQYVTWRTGPDEDDLEIAERTALSRAVRSVPLEFK